MPARLVEIEEGRRISSTPIRGDEFVIGRDPTSQLILDFARVSRRHAVVRELADRHTISDLGSSNGTRVNGHPIGSEPVLLSPGDVVDLAETVQLVYEKGPSSATRRSVLLAVAMVALLATVAGVALYALRTRESDAVMEQAAGIADAGRKAFEAGKPAEAKARLQEAAGILFREGYLDDVPRNRVMHAAMERLGERLGGGVDLTSIFEQALKAAAPAPAPRESPAETKVGCRLDRVPASRLRACVRERVELVLLDLRQDPAGIPPGFADEVGSRILYEYDLIREALDRGQPYVPMLRKELEKARMPPLLHYLAMIESGYRPNARSPAKAVGMWQFMPGTARAYGLRVAGGHDDREDPVVSTQAAARYLRDLAFEFGGDALMLALASYNRGENGVRRALKKLDDPFSDRSYWRLVEEGLLPVETSRYVTRFVAAAVAGEGGLPSREKLEEAGY